MNTVARKWGVAGLAATLASLSVPAWAEPLVVVAGASSSAPKLSSDQVAAIFLGTVKSFPNGEKAVPIDQTSGSGSFNRFYGLVAGKNEAQMKSYWARIVFTGKGAPPQAAGDSAAVKKLLASNPNLVGYIEATQVDASVKVLAEIK